MSNCFGDCQSSYGFPPFESFENDDSNLSYPNVEEILYPTTFYLLEDEMSAPTSGGFLPEQIKIEIPAPKKRKIVEEDNSQRVPVLSNQKENEFLNLNYTYPMENLQKMNDQLNFLERSLYETQNQMRLPISAEHAKFFTDYIEGQEKIYRDYQNELKKLQTQFMISPLYIWQFEKLKMLLVKKERELFLWKQEIHWYFDATEHKIFAELFITKQPFPSSFKNKKELSPIELCILYGPITKKIMQISGPCYAEINGATKKMEQNLQGNNERASSQGIIAFNYLKFPNGTKVKEIRLKFKLPVQFMNNGKMEETEIQTEILSEPFIIITNARQWEKAQLQLLISCCFKSEIIGIHEFFNLLQWNFVKGLSGKSRQETRGLQKFHFDYFIELSFKSGQGKVDSKSVQNFWQWFGPAYHKLNYDEGINKLWNIGLFWGFLDRNSASEKLAHAPVGTFLVRFSKCSGNLVVDYKQDENKQDHSSVRHVLVEEKTPIADFLKQQSFTKFLKISDTDEHITVDKASVSQDVGIIISRRTETEYEEHSRPLKKQKNSNNS